MTKATIRTAEHEPTPLTPSARIVASANQVEVEVDDLGRKIGVIKPTPLMRYDVAKMFGAEAPNQVVMAYAMLAVCVHSIDGELIQTPNSEAQVRMIIRRLGDEGLNAVGKCLQEKYKIGPQNSEDSEGIVKNS